jgi:2-dehydro-3-deoxy-D-gluconate 5-dehydrogenase
VSTPFSLAGRRALVTGGGGGIGRGLARGLAEAGATVCLLGVSERAEAEAAALRAAGFEARSVRADLGDRTQVAGAVDAAVAELGGLDVLVACHGTNAVGDSLDLELDDWDRVLEVNLTSVFRLAQLAGRRMADQGRGKIVTIASMLSFSGGFRAAAYAASKGGVAQLTKALSTELAPHGVNVNAIAPGYVRTELNRHIWTDPVRSEQVLARLPAGRFGEASDLAGACVFLSSSASDYIHGVILPVDGGWLAR